MSDRQEPCLEAAVREVLGASARRVPPSAPPVAAVLRAGRRRQRARRALKGATVAAAMAALCATVPLLRPDAARPTATPRPAASAPVATATPSATATPAGPTVLTLASGTLDGTGWRALARVDRPNFCLHMTVGTGVVDAPTGYWNNCLPLAESQPGEAVSVHVASGGPLRLLTAFGSETLARAVVTFTDGSTRSADAVRVPASTTTGAIMPIAPGQVISAIDLYDPHGVRVDHYTEYR